MKALRSLSCANFDVRWLSFMHTRQYSTKFIVVISSRTNWPDFSAAIRSVVFIVVPEELYVGGEFYIRLFLGARDRFSRFNTCSFRSRGWWHVHHLDWSSSSASDISCRQALCPFRSNNYSAFCVVSFSEVSWHSSHQFPNDFRIEAFIPSPSIALTAFLS